MFRYRYIAQLRVSTAQGWHSQPDTDSLLLPYQAGVPPIIISTQELNPCLFVPALQELWKESILFHSSLARGETNALTGDIRVR